MARTPQRPRTPRPPGSGASIRENLPRPAAAPAPVAQGLGRVSSEPQPHAVRRRSRLASITRLQPRFVADIIAELRKVTWPTFSETRYLTIVVVIVAVVMGLFLGGVDLFFGWAIEQLFF